jgi:hypothetical protein
MFVHSVMIKQVGNSLKMKEALKSKEERRVTCEREVKLEKRTRVALEHVIKGSEGDPDEFVDGPHRRE